MPVELRGLTPWLQVYDMPTRIQFYRDLLGFEVVTTSPAMGEDHFHWALLRRDGAELMLNTAYKSAFRPRLSARCGLQRHRALFRVPRCECRL
jgi:catechol 2,3-dioxygenase-like lactoylglutathione lyase family enzyme